MVITVGPFRSRLSDVAATSFTFADASRFSFRSACRFVSARIYRCRATRMPTVFLHFQEQKSTDQQSSAIVPPGDGGGYLLLWLTTNCGCL